MWAGCLTQQHKRTYQHVNTRRQQATRDTDSADNGDDNADDVDGRGRLAWAKRWPRQHGYRSIELSPPLHAVTLRHSNYIH
jgi:hypothetical protein